MTEEELVTKLIDGAGRLDTLQRLVIWIELKREMWKARGAGVGLLEKDGMILWPWIGPSGKLGNGRWVFVGTLEACAKRPLIDSDFVRLIIDDEMNFEHAMILIENAVEQVAGR